MTVPKFIALKNSGKKIAVLTAYDYPWASIIDQAGVDAILVGDSLAMVVQGHKTTLPVTLDQMIYHGEMVARAAQTALVIVDLPFMSYQVSPEQALTSAGRVIKETGAAAVKLEGGVNQAKTIEKLVDADIPTMAHIGMKPQSIRAIGSMGKIQRDAKKLLDDALAAEAAGAFSIVLELIPSEIAADISSKLKIPTIGIGAGPKCDGQVLVSTDMLGVGGAGFQPKFLKHYAQLNDIVQKACEHYIHEVREGLFPGESHTHH
jgi:3-methyl-2-oxobutanoate hydroxymethyltransferase